MKPRLSILVTAGPTREKIDPIRFISNYSTGTFGYEIAREAGRRGHRVTLITGPTCLDTPPGSRRIDVESARQMQRAVEKETRRCDVLIMAAAVSDWRPQRQSPGKIKRGRGMCRLSLIENPDILKTVSGRKGIVTVGFALETKDLEKNAAKKLSEKNLDMIVANRLKKGGNLFGAGKIDILIIDRLGNRGLFRKRTKKGLAKIILDKALNFNI